MFNPYSLKASPNYVSTPTQADYAGMVQARRRGVIRLLHRLSSEAINPDEWAEAFHLILQDGHSNAWFLGRALGGDLRNINDDDRLIGIAKADEDADYLQSFLSDLLIRDPRYWADDAFRESPVLARMNLYLGKFRGTANEALVDSLGESTEWYWRLGAAEDHCEDCPQIAALSPYTKDANLGYPGSGDTECLGNCTCFIETSNGIRGFDPA